MNPNQNNSAFLSLCVQIVWSIGAIGTALVLVKIINDVQRAAYQDGNWALFGLALNMVFEQILGVTVGLGASLLMANRLLRRSSSPHTELLVGGFLLWILPGASLAANYIQTAEIESKEALKQQEQEVRNSTLRRAIREHDFAAAQDVAKDNPEFGEVGKAILAETLTQEKPDLPTVQFLISQVPVDPEVCEQSLSQGVLLDNKPLLTLLVQSKSCGNTFMPFIIARRDCKLLKTLVDKWHFDVNGSDNSAESLWHATGELDARSVECLLKVGVIANNNPGLMSHLASTSWRGVSEATPAWKSITRMLLEHDAPFDHEDGLEVMARAVESGDVQLVRYLLNKGLPVDGYRKLDNATLLLVASGNPEMIKVLKAAGAKGQ